MKPEIRKQEGFTFIDDVVIELSQGLVARPSALIKKLFERYDNEVYLKKKDNPDQKYNAKEIMDLMCLEGYKGLNVQIYVEGEDAEAEELALMMYSGLTTDDFYPYFKRWEK